MSALIRRLNDRGRAAFREWLEGGAAGPPPYALLDDPTSSASLPLSIPRPTEIYNRRYDLGIELVDVLEDIDSARLQIDAGIWDWFSLCLIDQIAPPNEHGRRKPLKVTHYCLDLENYQRRNRHLVRTAWSLVRVHGIAAEYLLAGPLKEHSDVVEQLSAYQDVITCKPLIAAIRSLIWDEERARLKRGFAGRRGGSARRVPVVAKQLRLTYDLDSMQPQQILLLLPREFDRFREQVSRPSGRRPTPDANWSQREPPPEPDAR